jgi:hypothetical protein
MPDLRVVCRLEDFLLSTFTLLKSDESIKHFNDWKYLSKIPRSKKDEMSGLERCCSLISKP